MYNRSIKIDDRPNIIIDKQVPSSFSIVYVNLWYYFTTGTRVGETPGRIDADRGTTHQTQDGSYVPSVGQQHGSDSDPQSQQPPAYHV